MQESDFFSWRRELVARFNSINESRDVYALLQQQSQNLEFDYFALSIRHPLPFTRPKYAIYGCGPSQFLDDYEAENFFHRDPVLKRICGTKGEAVWSKELYRDCPVLWDFMQQYGVRTGRTLSVVANNRATGFLSVSTTRPKNIRMAEDELSMRLNLLTELSLLALARIRDPIMDTVTLNLSRREREVIQWTAEGKTSAEIAIILSISENTVNFHQKNMQKKLNTTNKTQIACYAAALGLI